MGRLRGEESSCPLRESGTFTGIRHIYGNQAHLRESGTFPQLVSPSPCHYFDRTFLAAFLWRYKVKNLILHKTETGRPSQTAWFATIFLNQDSPKIISEICWNSVHTGNEIFFPPGLNNLGLMCVYFITV